MKKLLLFVVLILISSYLSAQNASLSDVKIYGISDKVLVNVEQRLKELQLLKPLKLWDPEELRLEVIKAIQPYGYFKAQVSLELKYQRIKVTLGPQTRIRSILVKVHGEGKNNPLLLKTIKDLPIKVGDPLITTTYNLSKKNIINSAEKSGYLRGHFQKAEILIDETNNEATIQLIFDTGSLYYFGQIEFDPTYISPELLHRFLPFHTGDPYSTPQILKLNDNLANSGYFNSVLIKPEINTTNQVPVHIQLDPITKYSYSVGGGYGTDTGIRGKAALHVIPVNRQGHKFNALAQGSFTESALQAQYVVPGRNPVTDQYSLTGNFSNLNYNAGYSNALLVSLSQLHNIDYFQRALSINGLYENFHYALPTKSRQLLLYPKATFTFINTKNKLFSPSGYNVTFNGLGANQLTLSNLNLGQISVDAKAALTIDSLGLRLYAHSIQGYTAINNIDKLPLSLALLLGGTDNLKAYGFNSIGPGRITTYTGFEIQKEIKKNWYLIGLYDSGTVYNPSPKHMLYDLGVGAMWVSPIGPIKIGLAQAVNNHLQRSGTNPRLVISMGPDL